jgi:hypothetical protein
VRQGKGKRRDVIEGEGYGLHLTGVTPSGVPFLELTAEAIRDVRK